MVKGPAYHQVGGWTYFDNFGAKYMYTWYVPIFGAISLSLCCQCGTDEGRGGGGGAAAGLYFRGQELSRQKKTIVSRVCAVDAMCALQILRVGRRRALSPGRQ